MSLETHKENPHLKEELGSFINPEGKSKRSIPSALSHLIIEEATKELIAIDRLGEGKSPFSSTLTLERPVDMPNDAHKFRKELETMVYFGNHLLSVEDMLITGEYDERDFRTRVNLTLGSYGAAKLVEATTPPVQIEKTKQEAMRKVASSNKDLSPFIKYPKLLPERHSSLLEKVKMLVPMQAFLPDYQALYDKVVDQDITHQNEDEKYMTEVSLRMIDMQINAWNDYLENDPLQPRNLSKKD